MKTLFLDCAMGAAGDMLTAALLELTPDPSSALNELNLLGIPGVRFSCERVSRCGIQGTHVSVHINGVQESEMHSGPDCPKNHHRDMAHIREIVNALSVSESIKNNILSVYRIIAEAESAVHGLPVTDIHFHEVGALDAIADVAAVCFLMDRLSPDEVVVSPVCTGFGTVRAAHGVLPVPAPATIQILRGIPVYAGRIEGELCTPTGAALLKFFASRFGSMPVMIPAFTGYGMGTKDFEQANCVRAILSEETAGRDTVTVLSCNIDDMTAEEIGFAMEMLMENGALDAYTIPIGMKKNRPGTLLQVLSKATEKVRIAELLFRYTSTLGVRETETERFVMNRSTDTLHTVFGDIRVKRASGFGRAREKIEYEDLARIARDYDISLAAARMLLETEEL